MNKSKKRKKKQATIKRQREDSLKTKSQPETVREI